jgi:hypothetical protein
MPDPAQGALRDLQTAFAAHIRDPRKAAPPDGIEDRRMNIYRELFFNNIHSLLAGNFPVLRGLHDDDSWNALVRDFYSRHRCHTPLFPEVPREFLHYLQDERGARSDDPPFMLELAHYEWVELALSLDERDPDDLAVDTEADLLTGSPVLSPLAWPLSYRYPVHRIRPDYQPSEAPSEATCLLVYRDREYEVRFMQLNGVSRLLIDLMREQPSWSGNRMLDAVAERIGHPDPDQLRTAGATLLESLRDRDIVLGTRPA